MAIQFIDPKKAKPGTRMVSVIGEPKRVIAGEGGQVTAKKTQAAGKTEIDTAAVAQLIEAHDKATAPAKENLKKIAAGGRRMGKEAAQRKKGGPIPKEIADRAALGNGDPEEFTPAKRGPKKTGGAKAQITLRLDQDIIDKFKAAGAGWQSKINDALRNYLKLGAKK